MGDCIFCRIAEGTVPANIVTRTNHSVAFHDTNPQAPVHVLVIPTAHVDSARDARTHAGERILARTLSDAVQVAEDLGLGDRGYRLVTNVGREGGQSVSHLHIHVLGGRRMSWPPG